jgi:NAD(P)-dependent dehydrogenase (short-subunit alcohol dehydrogenase family)
MTEVGFDGRVAIVTGAGGGLGRSHALELARRGALVVVNDIGGSVHGEGHSTAAELVVQEIQAAGGLATANFDTVTTPEGGAAIVECALDTFGRVDILINNAGILRDKAFHHMDAETVDAVLDVHLKGAFNVTIPAFRFMRAQGYGRIVSTTSASGLFGNFGQANYGAAKAGLAGLTKVLCIEGERRNVRANAIAPVAHTRMTENILGDLASRVGPEYVTPVVVFLASEQCHVNGQLYSVAGGRVALIFVAESPGYVLDEPTAEAVRDNLQAIAAREGYSIPESLDDEIGIIAEALGR